MSGSELSVGTLEEFYLAWFICRSADAAQQAVGEIPVQAVGCWVGQRLGEVQIGQELKNRKNQDWTQPGGQLVLLRD